MPASLALFFGLFGRSWKLVASRRMQIIALLVILATRTHAQRDRKATY